jgi:hypothetical protein
MVETWGWETYSDFYRNIQPVENSTQSDALDAALKTHFSLTLEELEANFLETLRSQEITSETVEDVRLTVEFFDVMRRYQQVLDPSAYFLTAWLPNGPLMRENGIVADLVRRPSEIENLSLETLLVSANDSLRAGDYEATADALMAVNSVLDAIEKGDLAPFEVHPLAKAHFEIATILREAGYQVEKVNVATNTAQVVASRGWPDLALFEFTSTANHWDLVNSQQ